MAITGDGVSFYPLYWTYHDNWRYYRLWTSQWGSSLNEYDHFGHLHFFMLGFDPRLSRDAWFGAQRYKFNLVDVWGPRSGDPNQQQQYRVVGTPRWFFHMEELWRRVYIQFWDQEVETSALAARRGVKWDACAPDKIAGPFREGRVGGQSFAPVYIKDARTLPIDYFLDETRQQITQVYTQNGSPAGPHRTNHLGDMARSVLTQPWPYPLPNPIPPGYTHYDPASFNPAAYSLEHGNYLYAGGNQGLEIEPAARPPFSDRFYIWPIIEYQRVTQLDWQRFPGWEQLHDTGPDSFGDGWSVTIEAPFRDPVTGLYRSPFCAPGSTDVRPIGEYFNNLVPEARRPRHPEIEYDDPYAPLPDPLPNPYNPYYYDRWEKLPPSLSGQPVTWHNPFGDIADGFWVQQFLGAIVQAKAQVTIEHKFGGRQEVWVHATQYVPDTKFAGVDQLAPSPS